VIIALLCLGASRSPRLEYERYNGGPASEQTGRSAIVAGL
jgi:hypothetical protein